MDKATLVHSGQTVTATSQGSTVVVANSPDGGIAVSTRPGSGRDYEALYNKPSIEGHELIGDSTLAEIGIEEMTAAQAAALLM